MEIKINHVEKLEAKMKHLIIDDLLIGCLDNDLEVEINVMGAYEFIDKDKAIKIIDHLKEQFKL